MIEQFCLTHRYDLKSSYLAMFRGGARGVVVIAVGNEQGDTSSNLDETDCISHSTNTLGKGMNL